MTESKKFHDEEHLITRADNHIYYAPIPEPAISLRDWFAGMAMQGLAVTLIEGDNLDRVVKPAYAIADAMLKEREK